MSVTISLQFRYDFLNFVTISYDCTFVKLKPSTAPLEFVLILNRMAGEACILNSSCRQYGARVRRGQWDICSAGLTQWKHCCRDNARYHQSITGLRKSKDRDDLCGFGGLKRAELLKNGKKMTAVTASLWLTPRNFVWQEESGQIGPDFEWLPSPCSLTPTKS